MQTIHMQGCDFPLGLGDGFVDVIHLFFELQRFRHFSAVSLNQIGAQFLRRFDQGTQGSKLRHDFRMLSTRHRRIGRDGL